MIKDKNLLDLQKLKNLLFNKNAAIALAILGIAIIFFSDMLFSSKSNNNVSANTTAISSTLTDYVEKSEAKLKKVLEGIEGAGKCEVMITLEAGSEFIYATEKKATQNTVNDKSSGSDKKETSENTEDKYIIINDNGSEKPIVIKEIQPKIKGVAVICEGGDRAIVKNRVTETITTLLDVPANKVCVIKMN